MKKRCIAFVLTLIVCSLFLFGCLVSDSPYEKKDTTNTPEATNAPETTKEPETTKAPETTNAPETTKAPETTEAPGFDPFAPVEYERKKYHIEVSLAAQIVYVYDLDENGEKGELVKAMLCSTGVAESPTPVRKWIILDNDIPVGGRYGISHYRMQWLNDSSTGQYMSRMWNVKEENGVEVYSWSAYLFHSAPYAGMSSEKLKADEWNKLGTPASAGCVRLAVVDAKWIYTYVAPYSYVYTIEGEEDPELWKKLKLDPIPSDAKRDPTDVDKFPEA